VRQVGYLQELNRDARSTKHKNGPGVPLISSISLCGLVWNIKYHT